MTQWRDISTFDYKALAYQEVLVRGQDGTAVAFWDEEDGEFISDLRGKGNGQTVYGPFKWMPIPE